MHKLIFTLLFLAPSMLAAARGQDLKSFSDDEAGVRLKHPTNWKSIRPLDPNTILHLQLESKDFQPEIIVINGRMKNPTPVDEYKTQLKKLISDNYKDAKIGDPKDLTAYNRKGCQIEFEIKGPGNVDLVLVKTGISLGLRRYLIIDAAFPKAQAADLRKIYDQVVSSLEFYAGKESAAIEKGIARFDEFRKSIVKPLAVDRREELEILLVETAVTDRTLGSYSFSYKNGKDNGIDGYAIETQIELKIDGGGKSLIKSSSFVANDLTYQKVEISETSETAEKRTFEYKSTATMNQKKVHCDRMINGAKSAADFEVPEGTIFTDLIEWLQWRSLEQSTVDMHVRTLSVYDEHTEYVQMEGSPTGKKKPDDAYIMILTKPDGTVLNYTYGQDRAMVRLKGHTWKGVPQPIWMRAKAK